VLESYSAPLRSYVDWRATENGNVDVLNETADYYRYFDATAHAEFLYEAVAQTVEHDLPDEVRFLEAFDRFAAGVKEIVEIELIEALYARWFDELDEPSGSRSHRHGLSKVIG
jgi:hypothetical protein